MLDKCEKDKKELKKILYKDQYDIKQYLINNTLKSDVKYHKWINKHKINIFPSEFTDSYEFDIKNNSQNI